MLSHNQPTDLHGQVEMTELSSQPGCHFVVLPGTKLGFATCAVKRQP